MLCCFQKTQRLRATFGYLHFVVLSTPNTLLVASVEEKVNMKHPIVLSLLYFLLLHFLCPNAKQCVVSASLTVGKRQEERVDGRNSTHGHKPTLKLSVGVVQSLGWLVVCLPMARTWSCEPQQ